MFFVLSAYNCGDLSQFRAPSIHLFDADNPKHQLCMYDLVKVGSTEAVVMCSISRDAQMEMSEYSKKKKLKTDKGGNKVWKRRGWRVNAYGHQCAGTVRDYS